MNKANNYEFYLKVAIYALAGFAVYKVMQKLNILNEKEDDVLEGSKATPLNLPTQQKPSKENKDTLSDIQLSYLATDLYGADGYINDDEDKVFSILRDLDTQSNLEAFKRIFNVRYNYNLVDWLASFLSDSELRQAIKITENLKK